MPMKIKQITVGMVQTNCYIAYQPETLEAFIIDPGAEGERLIYEIEKLGLKPQVILLTHGHFDHAGAARELADHFQIQVIAHEAEKETLENPNLNLNSMVDGMPTAFHADIYVTEQDLLEFAGYRIKVLFTPGHTVGGACYYIKEEAILFSGDSLFCESIGRTDFPKGSTTLLVNMVKEKLLSLPVDTIVYPGHNEATTISHELSYNPYL